MPKPVSHSRPAGVERLAENLDKSLLDGRSYRVVRLPNQLEALLIHDADTEKASAAMDVNVGSFSDVKDLPGIAHAVEHILFMGTEKYPRENEYNSYLTKFGGRSNAFTTCTSTNYYFELSATSAAKSPSSFADSSRTSPPEPKASVPLYGALDRFAQFFIHPLFSEDTLDRELRAVDSENKKNLQNDQWRMVQLDRELSNENHPYHKFNTGNYYTLHDEPLSKGIVIRDAFMDFHKEQYSANRMKLVVLGREGLDELQEWVGELFSAVPNRNLPKLQWNGIPVYGESNLGIKVFVKPVMQERQLELHFPYPDEEDLWQSKPGKYIAYLVGHEGPGSLLAYLKASGWVNNLSAGPVPLCPGTGRFLCTLTLTEEGLKHNREIVKAFFQYVALLKDLSPQKWVVEEMARLSEIEFKFHQKNPASMTTSALSGFMQQPLPREQIFSGQYLITKFDPTAISRGLAALRPENFRYFVISQDFCGDLPLKEKWYGTEYKIERISADFIEELEATVSAPAASRPIEFHLPGKNEFVPECLDVEKKEVEQPATTPKLIRNTENSRTWLKKDDRFWVPKANLFIRLRSPITNVTPLASTLTCMYSKLVDDGLNEYSYNAEIAGLRYALSPRASGLDIHLSGYNDKMPVLLAKVLLGMRDLKIKEDRFEIVKESLLRDLRNFEYMEPFHQGTACIRNLLVEGDWARSELKAELESVTSADVRAFVPQIFRQMHAEILIHGNAHKEVALHITELIEDTLQPRCLPASQWPITRNVLLPTGSDYRWETTLKDPENINHCIEYIIMIGHNQDRPQRARLLLMAHILKEPCYNTLRTQEQLGYVVGSAVMIMNTAQGFRIRIQSEQNCAFLEKRISNFLVNFEKELEAMSEGDFEKHKISLINKQLEKPQNLSEESETLWDHIGSGTFDFDRGRYDAENINLITKPNLQKFFHRHFHPGSELRAKVAVHFIVQGKAVLEDGAEKDFVADDQGRNTILIQDVRAWKASLTASQGPRMVNDLTEFEDFDEYARRQSELAR